MTTNKCSTCNGTYEENNTFCSNSFHCCRDCVWSEGVITAPCDKHNKQMIAAKDQLQFRMMVQLLPQCSGEWLSGSGGHKTHSHDCNNRATYYDPDDIHAYCDEHITEHEKKIYKHGVDDAYAKAIRAEEWQEAMVEYIDMLKEFAEYWISQHHKLMKENYELKEAAKIK